MRPYQKYLCRTKYHPLALIWPPSPLDRPVGLHPISDAGQQLICIGFIIKGFGYVFIDEVFAAPGTGVNHGFPHYPLRERILQAGSENQIHTVCMHPDVTVPLAAAIVRTGDRPTSEVTLLIFCAELFVSQPI